MQGNEIAEIVNSGWDRRVRVFRVEDEVDTSVVLSERYAIFVDTMCSPEQITAVIDTLADELHVRSPLVLNTHADYDHAWGNCAFSSPDGRLPAPIIASAATGTRLRSEEERDFLRKRQASDPSLSRVVLTPPTIEFTGSCRIDAGDLTVELIATPGHTHDHHSAWIRELGLLLAGDAAEHPFPYCGEDADIDVLLASNQRLLGLRPVVIIPCHGGATDSGLLHRNRAYFRALDRVIRLALNRGIVTIDARDDPGLDRQVGYTFKQAIADQGPPLKHESEFYRESHRLALNATLRRVAGGGAPL